MYDKVRKGRAGRLCKEWQKGDYVKNGKERLCKERQKGDYVKIGKREIM